MSGSVERVDERLRLHIYLTDDRRESNCGRSDSIAHRATCSRSRTSSGPKISQILPAKVSEAELRRVAQRIPATWKPIEYFQRGQAALLVRQKTGERDRARHVPARYRARRGLCRAYAGLALTYAADYRNQWAADGPAALDRAFEMAQTAYQINPDIRETYWVLAFVHMERRQHEQAHAVTCTPPSGFIHRSPTAMR